MSASLVGSEMCIRDRTSAAGSLTAGSRPSKSGEQGSAGEAGPEAVPASRSSRWGRTLPSRKPWPMWGE
eukprot:5576926-Alexandrium_andersonii.AAC.1